MDRPHVDGAHDESLHMNELQRGCLDVTPPTTTTIGWEASPRYKTIIKQSQ
jgi:hypothetical protein